MESSKQPKAGSGNLAVAHFSSSFERTVERGRLSFPPEWRGKGWPTDFALLPWPLWQPEHLMVLPPERWDEMRRNIQPESLADEPGMAFQRLVHSKVMHRSLDDYGRLPLPEEAVKEFGLAEQAYLIGTDDKFEIWPPTKAKEATASLDSATIRTYMKDKKI